MSFGSWLGVVLSFALVQSAFESGYAQDTTEQSRWTDRRVPYYVMSDCDYMLDAGERCDLDQYAPAMGCCPMGHMCAQPEGESNVWRCMEDAPTYNMSPDCAAEQQVAAHLRCDEYHCCPDGFDCIEKANNTHSTCEWTGRPIVPPPGWTTKPSQFIRTDRNTTATLPKSPQGQPRVPMPKQPRQATCNTGFLCPATTITSQSGPACSMSGARWQAPSCKCYDRPLDIMMTGTPPALDVDPATGAWVVRGTRTRAAIKGINWFGFNNGQTMVDGLWAGYNNASVGDFPTVLKRIRLLGFNGLRLPFTFQDLDLPPKQNLYVANCRTDTKTQFRASLTPTYTSVSSRASQNTTTVYLANTSCPYDTRATLANRGSLSVSNKHVPGRQDSTTWNRFMWVVQYAVGQGFYVVIDYHFEQDGLQNNPTQFAAEWRRLWRDLVSLPTYRTRLSGRVFSELANEWDKWGCRWENAGSGSPSVTFQSAGQTSGSTLWDRLFRSWGSKSPASNLAAAGVQQQYGVMLTEFGSDCDIYNGLGAPKCSDAPFLRDIASYLRNNNSVPTQSRHDNSTMWFWWSWNANSGDTGGIVVGSPPGAPWYSVKWHKIRYLENVALCPWYRSTVSCPRP